MGQDRGHCPGVSTERKSGCLEARWEEHASPTRGSASPLIASCLIHPPTHRKIKRPALINPPLAERMCALVLGQPPLLPLFPAVGPSEPLQCADNRSTQSDSRSAFAVSVNSGQIKEQRSEFRCADVGCGDCGIQRFSLRLLADLHAFSHKL